MIRLSQLIRPQTLLGRTALALGLAFLLFGLLSAAVLQYALVQPHTRQAAEDLASFLVLVAQIWVELPPDTRPDYEKELLATHQLRIMQAEAPHPGGPISRSYLQYLQAALNKHLDEPVNIHRHRDLPGWLWADFAMGGRMMRLGFLEQRLQRHIFLIVPALAIIGLFIAFTLSILLVRRITHPLGKMAEATKRIGEGDFKANIEETGPREIAYLAHRFNRMEQRIGQLIENRTTLLAGISHDLRTPLARIKLELELLQGEQNRELVEEIGRDIDEMEQLIAQALILARGLGREETVETDVAQLVQMTAGDYRANGREIEVRTSGNCMLAVGPGALKRCLANLIDNAQRYGGDQPVHIECECAGDRIHIRVIDRGSGIPPEHKEAIFQPFHRLEDSRNKTTGGSGLGLAIVHQLCQANGWEVDLSSPPDGGSMFQIQLPRRAGSP